MQVHCEGMGLSRGYHWVFNFQVYIGAVLPATSLEEYASKGLIHNMVLMDFMEPYQGKGIWVFMDNFYISREEMESLETEIEQMLLKGATSPVETGTENIFFLAHAESSSRNFKINSKFSRFHQDFIMTTESTNDFVQEQLTGDDITANYELLRAAGLMHDPFVFLNNAKNSIDRAMMDLTRVVDALAKDVTERLTSSGKWVEALEV